MFKKKKIKNQKAIKIQNSNKIKKKIGISRSSIVGAIIGALSVFIILIIGLIIVSGIKINGEYLINFEDITSSDSYIMPKFIDGKLNILLVGIGGEIHNDAGDLTDTMILASLNKENKSISMLSIPRDLYVEFENGKSGKINDIYFRALKRGKTEEEAINELKRKISEISGEEIEYYSIVDFKGFKDVIDSLGGIEIDVPQKIEDYEYPDNNFGYEPFIIEKGLQTLDGETALKYARSRKSTNDFDRSLRQQLIIRATEEKIKELGFLTSPSKIRGLYLAITNNLSTNIKVNEFIGLGLMAREFKASDIRMFNLNDSCYFGANKCEMGGFMYYPPKSQFKGLSVTLPYGADYFNLSNYTTIQRYTNLIFNYPEIFENQPKINIFNGTRNGGLALTFANKIKRYGYNIPEVDSIGNARDQRYKKTVIYYNGLDENDKTLETLSLLFLSKPIKLEKAKFTKEEDVKIEIVIGEDFNSLKF